MEGMRHYTKDKMVGPAKPMFFVRGDGFQMQSNMVYEIAWLMMRCAFPRMILESFRVCTWKKCFGSICLWALDMSPWHLIGKNQVCCTSQSRVNKFLCLRFGVVAHSLWFNCVFPDQERFQLGCVLFSWSHVWQSLRELRSSQCWCWQCVDGEVLNWCEWTSSGQAYWFSWRRKWRAPKHHAEDEGSRTDSLSSQQSIGEILPSSTTGASAICWL